MQTDISQSMKFQLLGEVTFLLSASPLHRQAAIGDVTRNILPAIELNQFRIYRKKDNPVGFVAWAYFSEEVEQRFTAGPTELKLRDWRSGSNLFFVEFVAPFGHTRQVVQDLTINVFPGRVAKSLRSKELGKPPRLSRWTARTSQEQAR